MSYLGQIFTVDVPEDVAGTYITSFGIYIKSKDEQQGLFGYLTKVVSGFPDMTQILSDVFMKPDTMAISTENELRKTIFKFPTPVFVEKNKKYALVIHAEGNSPNYELWTAETGGTDLITGVQVFSNPAVGNLCESSDGYTWTAHQSEDLAFQIYRTRFTQTSSTAIFEHEPDDYLIVDGFTRVSNSNIGLAVGQYVFSVNATSNTIINSGNNFPFGVIQEINEATGELTIDSSTGGFTANTIISIRTHASEELARATITEVKNIPTHAIVSKFNTFSPGKSSVSYRYKGVIGSPGSFSFDTFREVKNNEEYEFNDQSRYVLSRSNEITELSSNSSSQMEIVLTTQNEYLAPMIDLKRGKSAISVENLINNDATDEETRYGSANSKYVSKTVILEEGQEAEDLVTYITAYRPTDTDIKVYAKFYNSNDPESFDTKLWTELEYDGDSELVFSNSTDPSDYFEYKFNVPTTPAIPNSAYLNANGVLTYQNFSNTVFESYKLFSLKVVLLSSNPVKVPRVSDIRSLALQV